MCALWFEMWFGEVDLDSTELEEGHWAATAFHGP